MFGLWLLPVSEVVEEAPIYLFDSLQLIIIVLVTCRLISFEDDNLEKIEALLQEHLPPLERK